MGKILLADDSITIQKVVEVILSKEGHELKIVGSGEEALSALESFKPNVILADIVMPGISGYQLTEEIRKNPETKGIPVILLAGAFEPIDQELADKSGANDSLIKPFESEDLVNKTNSLLLTGAAAPSEAGAAEEALEELEAEALDEAAVEAEALDEAAVEAEALDEAAVEAEALDEAAVEAEALDEMVLAEEPLEVEAEEGLLELENLYEDAAEAVEAEPAFEAEAEAAILAEAPGLEVSTEAAQASVGSKVSELISSANLTDMLKAALDEKLTDLINNTDLTELLKGAVEEKMAEVLKPGVINEVVIDVVKSGMENILEQSLSETVPAIVEKLLKEQLETAMGSVNKAIENIIWETVPDLSEAIINKEIAKIRSES
jgi:CheY-like chemotaxis protein